MALNYNGKNGFKIIEHNYRQIFPKYSPGISNPLNKYFYKIPLVKKSGLTEYFILNYVG